MGGRGASSGDVGKISQNLNAIRNAKRENLIIFDNNETLLPLKLAINNMLDIQKKIIKTELLHTITQTELCHIQVRKTLKQLKNQE